MPFTPKIYSQTHALCSQNLFTFHKPMPFTREICSSRLLQSWGKWTHVSIWLTVMFIKVNVTTFPLFPNFIATRRATLAQVRSPLPKSWFLACSDVFSDVIVYIILAPVMKSLDWLREVVDASTYMDTFLLPTKKGFVETKALATCVILGLFVILTVRYSRSPWRKLPPGSPGRLPILGNALQLRDRAWLLSKDCRERFGQFTPLKCPGGC
jgi:hypothetical protein